MKHTETEVLELVKEFELEPDMLDIWEDASGNLLVEGRGMQPLDGINLIASVDNGSVYFK
ncbi:TPA: hypothetical protein TY419_000361 [Streptococcus suis]|nr:hypothetical protein [Streptococcus suis]HEM2581367.1 hypothetical protein [Streptococcus suis]